MCWKKKRVLPGSTRNQSPWILLDSSSGGGTSSTHFHLPCAMYHRSPGYLVYRSIVHVHEMAEHYPLIIDGPPAVLASLPDHHEVRPAVHSSLPSSKNNHF